MARNPLRPVAAGHWGRKRCVRDYRFAPKSGQCTPGCRTRRVARPAVDCPGRFGNRVDLRMPCRSHLGCSQYWRAMSRNASVDGAAISPAPISLPVRELRCPAFWWALRGILQQVDPAAPQDHCQGGIAAKCKQAGWNGASLSESSRNGMRLLGAGDGKRQG